MKRYGPTLFNSSLILAMIAFFLMAGCTVTKLQKISVDALNSQLTDADLTIIDVRQAGHWQTSEFKIRGAVRENPYYSASWAGKYPKDRKIVLYCA